ncbi:MAG TPA: hypothetical protein V6C76_15275 [Drouetiella sp.]
MTEENEPDALKSMNYWTDHSGKLYEGWASYSKEMSPSVGFYECTGEYFQKIWQEYGFTGPDQRYEIRKELRNGEWTEATVREGDWGEPSD